ncbi:MAG: hypothetical protein PUC32_01695 [Oscillospiraceae bacterium]|nr:hypothetical protein [Oscillospiraceae bacterium]
MSNEKLHVYTICFPAYDSTTQLHGCLYQIRRNFFENGVSEKKVITDTTDGVCTKYSYYISQWGMGWKKTVDGHLLEYSVPEPDGCSILFQDSDSHHYEKIIYDNNLDWVKTYYYHKFNDSQIPAHSLELLDERGVLLLRSYDEQGDPKSSLKLYPGYSEVSSEINEVLDQESGKPIIYAATSRGEVCFCTAQQARLRDSAMEMLDPSLAPLDLEDIMVSTFDWDERGAQLFAECVLLLRGADADAESAQAEMEQIAKNEEAALRENRDVTSEYRRTIAETEDWIRQLKASQQPSDIQQAQELFSYSSEEAREQDSDLSEILALIHHIEEKDHPQTVHHKRVESEGRSLSKEMQSLQKAGKKMPSRYTVAGKKSHSKMVHASDVFDQESESCAG